MRMLFGLLLLLLALPALATPPGATPPAATSPVLRPMARSAVTQAVPTSARPGVTAVAASPPQLCEAAIATAEHTANFPPHMMGAIALVESGRPDATTGAIRPWPWTIDAEGQGAFFASKAEAIAAVLALQARGVHSIDVGCMQINLMYHPDAFASLDLAFDPDANARYAVHFLTALHAAGRDWPAAIAAYHSETPAIAAQYQHLVLARLGWPDISPRGKRYADFGLPFSHYRDFLPKDRVYGAFANAIDAMSAVSSRR